MYLKIQHFVIFITILGFSSCKPEPKVLTTIEGRQLRIDSSIVANDSVESLVTPYRNRINEVLDSTLTYAAFKISKDEGEYNTPAGNLMADIVLLETNPIYKLRTGNEIDFVLLNHGGIRSIISKGKVSARTAFEVMPFENSVVVVELSGKSVLELIDFLLLAKRAHPISGMQLVLYGNGSLKSVNIKGKPLDANRNYHIATSDYLVTGGDNMAFFKKAIRVTDTGYLIRNAMIDYFKKVDTLAPKIDKRFYKLDK